MGFKDYTPKNATQAFPEMLDRRKSKKPYKVTRNPQAMVNKVRRYLAIDETPSALGKLRHEYGHVIFTDHTRKLPNSASEFAHNTAGWIEDGRINLALARAGLPVDSVDSELDGFLEAVKRGQADHLPVKPFEYLLYAIARMGTNIGPKHVELLQANAPELMQVYEYVHSALNDPKNFDGPFAARQELSGELALAIEALFNQKGNEEQQGGEGQGQGQGQDEGEGEGEGQGAGQGAGAGAQGNPSGTGAPEGQSGPRSQPQGAQDASGSGEDQGAQAGGLSSKAGSGLAKYAPTYVPSVREMESGDTRFSPRIKSIEEMSINELKAQVGRHTNWGTMYDMLNYFKLRNIGSMLMQDKGRAISRCAPEGSVIRRIDRLYSDGHIFRAPAKNRVGWNGGTILLDISGSMHPNYESIFSMVRQAPYRTSIAAYAGDAATNRPVGLHQMPKILVPSSNKRSNYAGYLFGLAHEGKIIRENDLDALVNDRVVYLCYNVVDGPALEWLASMPEPRLWVSDGQVNGDNRSASRLLELHCIRLMKAHNIQRVHKVSHCIRYLKGDKTMLQDVNSLDNERKPASVEQLKLSKAYNELLKKLDDLKSGSAERIECVRELKKLAKAMNS